MRKDSGKIALSAARSAIERIKATGPPNVSIEKARQLLGPDLFRMIREGWLDDDIVTELSSGQSESDLRRLLIEARRQERRHRRKREEQKAAKKTGYPTLATQHSPRLGLSQSRGQEPGPTSTLPLNTSMHASLSLPAPPAQVKREDTSALDGLVALPPPDVPRPITRNRGIRRPD